jgi:hypothetical protein
MVEMALLVLVLGSVASFVAVFVAWYTMWHRRLATSFETVPVGAGRTAYVLRRGVALGGRAD